MPLSKVTVIPTSSDNVEGQVSTDTLLFSSKNWISYQILNITGVDENITDSTQSYQIDFEISTEDTKYSSLPLSSLRLSNQDDEVAGILLGTINCKTSESGGTATFTVKLKSQPEANFVIFVSRSNTDKEKIYPPKMSGLSIQV